MLSGFARLIYSLLPFAGNLSNDLRVSTAAMIIANLTAIIGTILYQWDAFHIMFLFWCESVIIGFYQILRILLSGWSKREGELNAFMAILSVFLACFFAVHFNGFNAGHLVFLLVFASISDKYAGVFEFDSLEKWLGIEITPEGFQILSAANLTVILILITSHGVSFFIYEIKNKEHSTKMPFDYMFEPYKRIILMHITIIVGAFVFILATALIGKAAGVAFLCVFIILKLGFDLREHIKRHTETKEEQSN